MAGFNRIAEVTFRLDTHKIVHERAVYSFIDWLGDVGGVGALLKCIFLFFFGDYMEFSQSIESTLNDQPSSEKIAKSNSLLKPEIPGVEAVINNP